MYIPEQSIQAPLSPFTGVPGYLHPDEEDLLIRYARLLNKEGATFVNLGVEYGRSVAALVKAAPLASVYGVEIAPKTEFHAFMAHAGLWASLLIGDSLDHARHWARVIDFLFVDDLHTQDHVLQECRLWTPFVRIGGVVAFHDSAPATNLAPHPDFHPQVDSGIEDWLREDGIHWRELQSVWSVRVFERVSK